MYKNRWVKQSHEMSKKKPEIRFINMQRKGCKESLFSVC